MILFLVNANKKVGYGHVSRSIAIANNLKNNNKLLLHGVGIVPKGLILDSFTKVFNKKKNILSIIKKNKIKKVILDRLISLSLIKQIKRLKCKIIQLNYKHHNLKYLDLVINHLVKKKNKKILCGLEYLVFNDKLVNTYSEPKYKNKVKLLVLCGGSYSKAYFHKIIKILSIDYLKNIEISLVCNKKPDIFTSFSKNIKVYVNPSKQIIKYLYRVANVGICPGGMQLSELISNRIITICVPKNITESKNAHFFAKMGLCYVINKKILNSNYILIKKVIDDNSMRKKIEENIKKNFFLLGSKKVSSVIEKYEQTYD